MARRSKVLENRNNLSNQYMEFEDETSNSSKKEFGIHVAVEWIENLDPCKIKEITVKMEFMNNVLVISDPIAIKNGRVDIDVVGTIQADEVNIQFLDVLLSNPVLITVMNSGAPGYNPALSTQPTSKKEDKEPKKKPSRLSDTPVSEVKLQPNPNLIGMCNLDLSALITDKKTIRECLLVDSDRKLPPMGVVSWVKLPKLWVNATTDEREIFDEVAKKMHNTLGITLESVYNAPDYISPGSVFEAKVLVPSLGDRNNMVLFPNGMVTTPKEAEMKKRWLTIPELDGPGARSNHCICPVMYDVINTMQNELDLDEFVQKLIPVIQWNMWRNSLLVKSDINYFYSKLIKFRVWPIEIAATYKLKDSLQKSTKLEKKRKSTPTISSLNRDHFLAFINLSPLLYPGVTKARVASQLYTYSPSDLISKFGPEHPSLYQGGAGSKTKGTSERSKSSIKEFEESKAALGVPLYSENGLPVFVIVEVELLKPLTPKQNPEYLLSTLRNYVLPEGRMKKITKSPMTADERFANAVKSMVFVLGEEYEEFCQTPESQNSFGFDCAFQEFLCRRENFYKMKTTLEHEVIEIINEKFGPKSRCDDIPDMYIYLVEAMHKITNRCVMKKEESALIFNIDDFQLFAEEAMEEGECELAKYYLYQKLSSKVTNPDYWLDCAIFFQITDQTERAIEAVREVLYLDFNHQLGLLMYALLMEKIRDLQASEVAFQVLLSKYPDFLEGWMAFWLYCYANCDTVGMFVALQTAKKLNYELKLQMKSQKKHVTPCNEKTFTINDMKTQFDKEEDTEDEAYMTSYQPENKYFRGDSKYGVGSFKNGESSSEPLAWSPRFAPIGCMYIKMAVFMMRLGFYEYSSMCLTQYIYPYTASKKKVPYYYYYEAVNNYLLGRYSEAIPHLQNFVKDYGKDCYVWGLMGHCYYKLQNHAQAIACYEYVLEAFNRPADIHLIYLRMGYYYLGAKKFPCAKKILHTACKYSPTPKLWKGLGIACLRMEEPEEAEIAFSEANYLDSQDPETWAYLAITNSVLGRLELYKNCYEEAKKRNLQNHELILELESCNLLNVLESEVSFFFGP